MPQEFIIKVDAELTSLKNDRPSAVAGGVVSEVRLPVQNALLACSGSKGCSGSCVRGAARINRLSDRLHLSMVRFHPAVSYLVGGMNARGGVAAPPRIPRLHEPQASGDSFACASGGYSINCKHAPGYFPAEHHGTAEHQKRADVRTRRGLRVNWSLTSTFTGAWAGARGGPPRHRQFPKVVRNTVSLKTRLPVPGHPLRYQTARPAQQQREPGQGGHREPGFQAHGRRSRQPSISRSVL